MSEFWKRKEGDQYAGREKRRVRGFEKKGGSVKRRYVRKFEGLLKKDGGEEQTEEKNIRKRITRGEVSLGCGNVEKTGRCTEKRKER